MKLRDVDTGEAARFWRKVSKGNACWIWMGGVTVQRAGGYGSFWTKATGHIYAHRWAYIDRHGAVPPGMQLDHLCRVTLCVNPDHLQAVTPRENHMRSPLTNGGRTHCKNGHGFTAENTRLRIAPVTAEARRQCRTCDLEWQRANNARVQRNRRARRKAASNGGSP